MSDIRGLRFTKRPEELNNLAGKPKVAATERELKAAMQEKMILDRDYVLLPLRGDKN